MGFSGGYVTARLKVVFRHVLDGLLSDFWIDDVPEEFHCLSGELMTVENHGLCEEETVKLKAALAPPAFRKEMFSSKMQFFNEEEYGKRLFGNAWNVPTVVSLLEPLKEVFAQQVYEGFDYTYAFVDPDAVESEEVVDYDEDEDSEEEDDEYY